LTGRDCFVALLLAVLTEEGLAGGRASRQASAFLPVKTAVFTHLGAYRFQSSIAVAVNIHMFASRPEWRFRS
jgi:hypothetical protein